jgi:hypothetical protein
MMAYLEDIKAKYSSTDETATIFEVRRIALLDAGEFAFR